MAEILQDLKLKNDPDTIVRPNIVPGNIPSGAIDSTKLAAGAVTASKIGTGAVTASALGTGAVTASAIGSNAVTSAKIANAAITKTKIADGTITLNKIDNANASLRDLFTAGESNADAYAALALLMRDVSSKFLYDDGEIVANLNLYIDSSESPAWCFAFMVQDDGTLRKIIICDDTHTIDDFLASYDSLYCKVYKVVGM